MHEQNEKFDKKTVTIRKKKTTTNRNPTVEKYNNWIEKQSFESRVDYAEEGISNLEVVILEINQSEIKQNKKEWEE